MRKLIAIALVSLSIQAVGQDSLSLKQKRAIVVGGNAIAYSAAMTGLYQLWYKDYPLTTFHWFNDNGEWNQMDKCGHAFSCYYEGLVGIAMMEWAGYNHKVSSLIGGSYGFIIQAGIETFDGFSEAWGASSGDLMANAFGTALVVGQSLAWDEQRILLKFSYSPTEYAEIRPNLLGSNAMESLFKDYNGQTYWLSLNPNSFTKNSSWPVWLNIAIGYGAGGMLGGDDNIFENADGSINMAYADLRRYRQFYLSPDIDLSKIKTERKALRFALTVLNSIKVPFPALEYSQESFKLHALTF